MRPADPRSAHRLVRRAARGDHRRRSGRSSSCSCRSDLEQTVDRERAGQLAQIAQGYSYEGAEDFQDVSAPCSRTAAPPRRCSTRRRACCCSTAKPSRGADRAGARARGRARGQAAHRSTSSSGAATSPTAPWSPRSARGRQRVLVVAQSLRRGRRGGRPGARAAPARRARRRCWRPPSAGGGSRARRCCRSGG